MNDTEKLLNQAFATLCDIAVKGADVERMAMVKALVRQAAESPKTKADTSVSGAKKE